MGTGPHFRVVVAQSKDLLQQSRDRLRLQHETGSPGIQVCAHLTKLLDEVVVNIFSAALVDSAELGHHDLADHVTLVAHGGYGRRDVAPYSDLDLLLLHRPEVERQVAPLARRLVADFSDLGLKLGFNPRTPQNALTTARSDATVLTSLMESQYLVGNEKLFDSFKSKFRRMAHRTAIPAIEKARREERSKYGDTNYLLRPNVKRSAGGLRDIQLLRWVGYVCFGESDPHQLLMIGKLSRSDYTALRDAYEFLLRIRNDLHFHAGKAADVLDRAEQIRLAERYAYEGSAGVLPVEEFMREYFEQTAEVRHIVTNFVSHNRPRWDLPEVLKPLVSHRVGTDYMVGPRHINATRRGREKLKGNLNQVLQLMDLANLYGKDIGPATWNVIRESMSTQERIELSREAAGRFLSLMSQSARLGDLLHRLHELRVLEKIVPGMPHARSLLQFNEYHKFTVDEHCIQSVQKATEFYFRDDVLGDVYRNLQDKHVLHLALLIHDLGKGFDEDHSEVGRRLAIEAAERLELSLSESDVLQFLVHKHLIMPHLAMWRDTTDDGTVINFAVEVGSLHVLQMLYVLSCADLAAVGPDVLNDWKLRLITDLYSRASACLAGESATALSERRTEELRKQVRLRVKPKTDEESQWWDRQLTALPATSLQNDRLDELIAQLRQLQLLDPTEVLAAGCYRPELSAVEYTIGAHESLAPGIFHRLTGALSSRGMEILSAEIHTLADGLVLDRFYVLDGDFEGPPPPDRIDDVCHTLKACLQINAEKPPAFRRVWGAGIDAELPIQPTRIRFDNSTSPTCTILDVFTHDYRGLLYTLTRTIFDLGLSVSVAKIGTHVDQVVDVFYVTDAAGNKITDNTRLTEIEGQLREAIDGLSA